MKKIAIGFLVAFATGAVIIYLSSRPPKIDTSPILAPLEMRDLDIGLNSENKEIWHHMDEGSGFIPLSFFYALEDAETKRPFIEVLPRYGLIADPKNKLGLPIGLSVGKPKTEPTNSVLVGMNCSACHSGQYNYKEVGMTIDGAPNMLNFEALLDDLTKSVKTSVESPVELLQFVRKIIKAEHDVVKKDELFEVDPATHEFITTVSQADDDHPLAGVRNHLEEALHTAYHAESTKQAKAHIEAFSQSIPPIIDSTKTGQVKQFLDTFGNDLAFVKRHIERLITLHKAFVEQTVAGPGRADSFDAIWDLIIAPDHPTSMDAPVSIPHLFDYTSFHWVHWDGNTSTVMARDFAQAIALGADYIPETGETTVIPENVIALETVAMNLKVPKWPEDVLGKIDRKKANLGKAIYQNDCATCHSREKVYPLEEIGTDPWRALDYSNLKKNGKTYAELLQEFGTVVLALSYRQNGINEHSIETIERSDSPQWRTTKGYHTRTLKGIWASPPYLHNGSVPTIWDLLKPATKRPKEFLVGRELDPKKVGIDTKYQPTPGGWRFNTNMRGNGNQGHEYGVELSDEEKWKLVEYLKTL